MNISHYLEFGDHVTGGIRESALHQREIFRRLGHDFTPAPTLDADVFHCNLMGPRSVWNARRARAHDVPVVVNTHVTAEDFGDSFRFTNLLAKPLRPYLEWAYGLADQLICPSEYNRRLIEGYTDVPTTVISNGVDRDKLDGLEDLEDSFRDRYDLDPPVVFLVGHVIKRKGLETFVELARRRPELDFAWFGPLDLSLKGRETRRLIENAPGNCTFTGYVDDIRGAYAAGDIFLFPTHEENEGIALLEAMSVGTPVVVRDIDTFDWLEHGHDCRKAEERFDDELAALRDPEERARVGANARQTSERFALSNTAEDLGDAYARVAG